MNNNTPGPWRLSYDNGYYVETEALDSIGRICTVHTTRLSDPIAAANTKLLAAAPEMYEALVWIRDQCTGLPAVARAIAEKAVAKAESR